MVSISTYRCSDEPNALGIGLLPPQDALKIDSLETRATFDTTYLSRISGNSTTLLIGKVDGFETRALIDFDAASSIPKEVSIDSAKLVLTLNYRFKDSSGTIGIAVHEMLRSWNEGTFTWDSLTAGTYSDTADTSILKSISAQDSALKLRLDKTVRRWQQIGTGTINGLILIPSVLSNIVLGARSSLGIAAEPELTISYHDTSDTTLTLKLRPRQRTFVANGALPPRSGLMFVQAGISYRGLLKFDSLVVPRSAGITQAFFEFAVDTTASISNGFSKQNLVIYLLRENISPYKSLAFASIGDPLYNGSQKFFRADAKAIVQQWATGFPNFGIVIAAFGEYTTLDRFALHGAKATLALRPKLKIIYSALP